jgi:hypothetical protein
MIEFSVLKKVHFVLWHKVVRLDAPPPDGQVWFSSLVALSARLLLARLAVSGVAAPAPLIHRLPIRQEISLAKSARPLDQ